MNLYRIFSEWRIKRLELSISQLRHQLNNNRGNLYHDYISRNPSDSQGAIMYIQSMEDKLQRLKSRRKSLKDKLNGEKYAD